MCVLQLPSSTTIRHDRQCQPHIMCCLNTMISVIKEIRTSSSISRTTEPSRNQAMPSSFNSMRSALSCAFVWALQSSLYGENFRLKHLITMHSAQCTLSDFLLLSLLNWYIVFSVDAASCWDVCVCVCVCIRVASIISYCNYCSDYSRITLDVALGSAAKPSHTCAASSSRHALTILFWLRHASPRSLCLLAHCSVVFIRINSNQTIKFQPFSINGKLKFWLGKLMRAN